MPSTFWATQPVDDRVGVVAPGGVGGDGLPDPLRFAAFDPSTAADLERLRALLAEHYVEDGETGFRLEYGRELLAWALGGAGQERDWCVAVEDGGGRMGGFVFAAPARVSIDGWTREAVMVNYLCVRSDLRGMGLGPILIREVTRRVVARGRSCAIFSTAARLPMEPLAACRYLCRFLRPSELVASGWVARPDYLTPGQFERIHELPEPAVALRRMTEADLPEVTALFDRRTSAVRLQLTAAELRHALVGAPAGVVETWVTEDGAAVGSYVRTVMRNAATRAAVEAAYWFLAASPAELTASLFDAVCRRAAEGGAQVLFALDTGPLASIGRPRGLMPTNGGLRHYTYNWRVAPHPARDIDVATV